MQRLLLKRIRQRARLLKNQLNRAHADIDARSEASLQAGGKNSSPVGGMPKGDQQVVGTVRCAVRAAPSGATCGLNRTPRAITCGCAGLAAYCSPGRAR